MVMQVHACCCGCSLKTGTIIIAVLGILGGLFMIAGAFTKHEPQDQNEAFDLLNKLDGKGGDEHEKSFSVVLKVVMALVEIVMSIVLMIGAVQGRPKLVFSWIVLNVVQTGLAIIAFATVGIYLAAIGLVMQGLMVLAITTIAILIQVYYILVVNSFHTTILSPPAYEYTMTKEPIMQA